MEKINFKPISRRGEEGELKKTRSTVTKKKPRRGRGGGNSWVRGSAGAFLSYPAIPTKKKEKGRHIGGKEKR